MKEDYIQMPPLPRDCDPVTVQIIWMYAVMSDEERGEVRKQLEMSIKGMSTEELDEYLDGSDQKVNISPALQKFADGIRSLISKMIISATELSTLVFIKHCIEEKPLKEIAEELEQTEDEIALFTRLYDLITDSEGLTS